MSGYEQEIKQPSSDFETLAKQIAQELLESPNILHEKEGLLDPIKGITALVQKFIADYCYSQQEILLVLEYPLAGEFQDLPQMLLLQLYKALSNPSLSPYMPEKLFKSVESICMRIYYSITYQYTQSQINAMEETLKTEAGQEHSVGANLQGASGLLKAVLEWKQSISKLQSVAFVKRFQKIFSTTKTHTQKEMSASQAMSILDNLLATLGTTEAVFCYKPILNVDQMIREKMAHQTVLDKIWNWFQESLLGQAVSILLFIPLLLIKTIFNLFQFIALFLPFRKLLGRRKVKMLFIVSGYDTNNSKSNIVMSQLKTLLHNPIAMVLLIHE